MANPKLVKAVRDREGTMHLPNEEIKVTGETKQSNFSDRKLIQVIFLSNNKTGAIFSDELSE
jgi:hypothetical protein